MVRRFEVLLNNCISFVGDLYHVVVDSGLFINLPKAAHIHVGYRNHELDIEGFQLFGVLSGCEVADVEAPFLSLPRFQYTVYFFVRDHTLVCFCFGDNKLVINHLKSAGIYRVS